MAGEPGYSGREVVVFQAWLRLEEHEVAHPGQPYATVHIPTQGRH
jgi:hypothetical protein